MRVKYLQTKTCEKLTKKNAKILELLQKTHYVVFTKSKGTIYSISLLRGYL